MATGLTVCGPFNFHLLSLGKLFTVQAKAGMVHFVSVCTWGVQVKL